MPELNYENLMELGKEYVKERTLSFASFAHLDFFRWLERREAAQKIVESRIKKLSIEGENFEVWILLSSGEGGFEHNRLGDDLGGELVFENKKLVDYDGVCDLPAEVIKLIEQLGYNADYAKGE